MGVAGAVDFGVGGGSTVGLGVDASVHFVGEDGPLPLRPLTPPPLPEAGCLRHPRHRPPMRSFRLLPDHETQRAAAVAVAAGRQVSAGSTDMVEKKELEQEAWMGTWRMRVTRGHRALHNRQTYKKDKS